MKQEGPYPQSFAFCCPRVEQPAHHWSPRQRRLSSPRSHTNIGLWHSIRTLPEKKVTLASQIWCPSKVLGFIAKIPRLKSRQFWGLWKSQSISLEGTEWENPKLKEGSGTRISHFSRISKGYFCHRTIVHFVSYEKAKQHIQKDCTTAVKSILFCISLATI